MNRHRRAGSILLVGIRMVLVIASVFLILMIAPGCATKRIDWTTRIGTYTYDDAIRELGPPDKSAKLTTDDLVADWLTARGMRTATTYGGGWAPYGGYGWSGPGMVVVDPPRPDRYLRLMFDAQGKLISWQKVYR